MNYSRFFRLVVFGLFGLLFMTAPSIAQTSQTEKKDYLDFDSDGQLLAFKKTAPDGSWIEVLDKHPGTSPYFDYLTVHCSDGEVLEAFWYHLNTFKPKDVFYKTYVEKAKSFDTVINDVLELASHDEYKPKIPAVCTKPDGTVIYYTGEYDTFTIDSFSLPLEKEGDFIECAFNKKYKPLHFGFYDNIRFRYFDNNDLTDEMVEGFYKVRKTYDNCILELTPEGNGPWAEIYYNDGSSYSGYVQFENDNYTRWQYWIDNKTMPTIKYLSGYLTTTDKETKVYENGEYSEFETIRFKQAKAKKEAEEKAQVEATKKAIAELNKKYGEKYVKAMMAGDLILGTPEELFLIGMEIKAYKGLTKANRYYSSGQVSRYRVYGWRVDTSKKVMMTNAAFLGYINFTNGVLSSTLKK